MSENSLLSRLDGIEARFEEVSTLITDPAVISDMKRYVRLTKEYKELEKLTNATRCYRNLLDNINEAREVLDSESDEEMRSLAKEELDDATARIPQLEEEIKLLLIPADPDNIPPHHISCSLSNVKVLLLRSFPAFASGKIFLTSAIKRLGRTRDER